MDRAGAEGENSLQERFKMIQTHRREKEIQKRYDTDQLCSKSHRQHLYWAAKCLVVLKKCNHFFLDFFMFKSPEIFVISWILGGMTCLIVTVRYNDAENPLFSTGQTWLGIAVTRTYTYFGVSPMSAKTDQDKQNERNDDDKLSRDTSLKSLGSHPFREPSKFHHKIQHKNNPHNNNKRSRSPASVPDDPLDKTDEYDIGDSEDDSSSSMIERDKEIDQETKTKTENNCSKTERRSNNLGKVVLPETIGGVSFSESIYSSRQKKNRGPVTVLQTGETRSLDSIVSIGDGDEADNTDRQGPGSCNSISLQMSADDEIFTIGDDDKV